MPWSIRTSKGGDYGSQLVRIRKAVQVTKADLLYAVQRQRTRVLDRTQSGLDANGRAFKAYSQNGPYYFYPSAHLGTSKAAIKTRKRAVSRILKLTGGYADYAFEKGLSSVGGAKTRDGLGIRFESYADAKASFGRAGVDLFGLTNHPHMLQALEVQVPSDTEARLGVYGEAAGRARGHNEGTKSLPKREWLKAAGSDLLAMSKDIYERVSARLRK
jgi:hypothetical protein